MTLRGTVSVKFDLTETGTGDLLTPTAHLPKVYEFGFSDGAGLNQANLIFSDTRTLAPSAAEDLDLAGVLVGALGGVQTYARVKGIWFRAHPSPTNTNSVVITRPAANGVPWLLAAGDGMSLPPGAANLFINPTAAGVVVTPGTGDLINVANSAGVTSVTYDVVVFGASS